MAAPVALHPETDERGRIGGKHTPTVTAQVAEGQWLARAAATRRSLFAAIPVPTTRSGAAALFPGR